MTKPMNVPSGPLLGVRVAGPESKLPRRGEPSARALAGIRARDLVPPRREAPRKIASPTRRKTVGMAAIQLTLLSRRSTDSEGSSGLT